MNKLIEALKKIGHTFVGVIYHNNEFTFYAHNPKAAGRKPIFEYCRDDIDYRALMSEWRTRGTYILFVHEDFWKALEGAIDSAKS